MCPGAKGRRQDGRWKSIAHGRLRGARPMRGGAASTFQTLCPKGCSSLGGCPAGGNASGDA